MTSLKTVPIRPTAVPANTCDASDIGTVKSSSRYIIKVTYKKKVKLTLMIQPMCNHIDRVSKILYILFS